MLLVKSAHLCSTLQVQHHCWKFCNHPQHMEVVKMHIFIYNITNIISLLQMLRVSIKNYVLIQGQFLLYLFHFDDHLRMTEM